MTEPRQTNDADEAVLRDSKEGREVKKAASLFAKSRSDQDHAILAKYMPSPDFLGRLDGPENYKQTWNRLRLARIGKLLIDNRQPSVDKLILELSDTPTYNDVTLRKQVMIRMLAPIRPAPERAIAYWTQESAVDGLLVSDVVSALIENQSPPAMALLERKLAEPHPRDDKIVWFHHKILVKRNDAPLLGCCERSLTAGLPADLKPELVGALFDFRPNSWYVGCDHPEPPPRAGCVGEARETLGRIGRQALAEGYLAKDLESVVRAELEGIGEAP